MRWWLARLIPIYTACINAAVRVNAINASVASQGPRIVGAIAALIECWGSGRSLAYQKKNTCAVCSQSSEYCGKSGKCSGSACGGCGSSGSSSDGSCDCGVSGTVALATFTAVVNQLIPVGGGTVTIDGTTLLAYLQQLNTYLQCQAGVAYCPLQYATPVTVTSTYTIPATPIVACGQTSGGNCYVGSESGSVSSVPCVTPAQTLSGLINTLNGYVG